MERNELLGEEILGYHVEKVIHSGSSGTVYRVTKKDISGTYTRALKHISVPSEQQYLDVLHSLGGDHSKADDYFAALLKSVSEEIRIQYQLSESGNEHIVKCYQHAISRNSTSSNLHNIYILMEYLTPFQDYVVQHGLTVREVIQLAKDILKALVECHGQGIIHRDIKDANLFVSKNGTFKLGDFGVSKITTSKHRAESLKGSLDYMAPEVYLQKGDYDHTVDLYSLGIVLYRVLNKHRSPFMPPYPETYTPEDDEKALALRMKGATPEAPLLAQNELGQAILKALQSKEQRYQSAQEFLDAIEAAEGLLPSEYLDTLLSFGKQHAHEQSSDALISERKQGETLGATLRVEEENQLQSNEIEDGPSLFDEPVRNNSIEKEEYSFEDDQPPSRRNKGVWIVAAAAIALVVFALLFLFLRGCSGEGADTEEGASADTPVTDDLQSESPETEPVHEHVEVVQEGFPASCEETGLSEGKYCTDCDAVLEEQTVISALGHDYVDRKCSRCQKIYYSSGLTYERIQDGYSVVSGLGTCADIDLFIPPETPEGDYVIGIASKAFKGQVSLKTVELPEGMTSIGSEAFVGCGSLEEIIIPDSVIQVGFSAFSECSLLRHTEYDHGFYLGNQQNPYVLLTDINDDSALMHVLIHGKTRVIGDSAFAGCRGLESVTIPDSVETINLNAFGDCISLKTVNYTGTTGEWLSIDIAEGNQPLKDAEVRCLAQDVPEISGTCGTHVMWAFDTVSGLLMVWGDGSMAWASETTPWDEYRDRIESVVVKEGVTNVAEKAFSDCVNLKSVHLSDTVTTIDSEAFQNCANLVSITIPSGVTSIRENAFSGCTNIRSLVLGESLTHIGENALNGVKDVTFRLASPSLLNSIIPSGANSITLDISNLEGTLDGVVFAVPETVGYFALIGDGDTYSDFRIQSNAGETLISKLGIAESKDTPLWLNSSVVTLRDVTVLDVPGFALVMPADHTVLKLIGSTTVGSRNEYSVLSGQVSLEEGSNTLEGSLSLTGKYMVYGDVSNRQLIHGGSDSDIVLIDGLMFSNMLTFSPVMFDAEEGTVDTEKIQVRYGHPYGELPVPQRTYYTFLGWFTDPESGDQVIAETIAPAMAEQTLYAHWKLNTFTVTFVYDYDGAPVSSESKTMTCGVAFSEVPNPSRAHYMFGGWYTESGTAITADTVMHEAKDITVYAKWTIIAYNINWKTDVGYTITVKRTSSPNAKAPTGDLSSGAKIYYGDVLSVEYSAVTGYALASQGNATIKVSGDVTTANIYATANVKSYTVNWKTGTGYTISVKRVSSPLKGASNGTISNGGEIYHGDELSVEYSAVTGYALASQGNATIKVSGDVTTAHIYATANVKSYTVNWKTGIGYTISVKRVSSPLKGASTGVITSGGVIYHGDVLTIDYIANTGYTLTDKGSESFTVTGNLTSSNIFASAKVNAHTVSWTTGTGYTISVKRTSSPLANVATGTLANGATVYYGDVLTITYTANTGYSLSSKGNTSITVTGNVTSSSIYATATANSYTYSVVYKSSNGTPLGTSSCTYKYGTTNTVHAPAKTGYNAPASQSVKWDSTSDKTITFVYAPVAVGVTTKNGQVYRDSGSVLSYSAKVEHQNRTANSVQIRVTWTSTLSTGHNNNGLWFRASVGNVSTGNVNIVKQGAWGKSSSSRSATGSSGWITVPLSTTNQTSVSVSVYHYQANANGTDVSGYGYENMSATWAVAIPAH